MNVCTESEPKNKGSFHPQALTITYWLISSVYVKELIIKINSFECSTLVDVTCHLPAQAGLTCEHSHCCGELITRVDFH